MKALHLLAGVLIANALYVPWAVAAPETKEPVKVFMVNSSDTDFIEAVYGELLKKMGYRVKYVQADFVAHFSALETGDIDVSLGAFQTNGVELTKKAVSSGKVENFGPTGVKVTEGWWYSSELKAACPGLPAWEALKEAKCVKALETTDTAPKGRYVDAPADWGTGAADRIKELGLNLTSINSGSAGALVATVKGSLDRKEPLLAWGFLPHWLYTEKAGAFVNLPEQKERSNVDVLKLANKKKMAQIPQAAALLKAFTLSANDVREAMVEIDTKGVTVEAEARKWVAKNEAIWKKWIK